jgi:hypothetical protein
MLFGPRAHRYGTSQTLSVGDGLTRKPIGDCCVYWDHNAQGVSGLRRRISRCSAAARWLPLHLVDVSF